MVKAASMAILIALTVVAPVRAQKPPIGSIDFYGASGLDAGALRTALQLGVGDSVPRSFADAQARLEKVPGVASAVVTSVCCEGGRSLVYVGVQQRGTRALELRQAPTGPERAVAVLVRLSAALDSAMMAGVRADDAAEDDSKGHTLFNYPPARRIQEQFPALADQHIDHLRAVLRNSADAEHRAIAATVLPYSSRKAEIIADLMFAISDPSPGVRNNSMRALGILAAYATRTGDAKLRVPLDPFIAMMNSLVWTDRNKASFVLMNLTESKNKEHLRTIAAGALQPLIDMSNWQSMGHAMPGFIVVARIAGVPEQEAFQGWSQPAERARIIAAARAAAR